MPQHFDASESTIAGCRSTFCATVVAIADSNACSMGTSRGALSSQPRLHHYDTTSSDEQIMREDALRYIGSICWCLTPGVAI